MSGLWPFCRPDAQNCERYFRGAISERTRMNIYLDPFRLLPPNGAFEVADEPTFVEARRRILAYQRGIIKIEPTFIIYERPYTAWFEDVQNWLVEVYPRSILSERYPNLTLPKDLSDADVIALELLTADIEPTVSGLNKHYFGSLLSPVETSPAKLLALVQHPSSKV